MITIPSPQGQSNSTPENQKLPEGQVKPASVLEKCNYDKLNLYLERIITSKGWILEKMTSCKSNVQNYK